MTVGPSSPRHRIRGVVADVLGDAWVVKPHSPVVVDALQKPTAFCTFSTMTPTETAGVTEVPRCDVYLLSPHLDYRQAEDALDAAISALLLGLARRSDLVFVNSQKTVVAEYLAWIVTCEVQT